MAKFLVTASYTAEGLKGLHKDKASGRQRAVREAFASVGGSQAHENQQPYLTLNFCIALQGIFPSQN